jgi:hypothetical protein
MGHKAHTVAQVALASTGTDGLEAGWVGASRVGIEDWVAFWLGQVRRTEGCYSETSHPLPERQSAQWRSLLRSSVCFASAVYWV